MFTESAELYDAIVGTFKTYGAEAQAYATLIRDHHPSAKTLLDVACGTGEHVKHFRTKKLLADGLDLDAKLIGLARAKVPDARFFVADMRDFSVPAKYDVIACLFSAIGYVKTIDAVRSTFQAFHRHLAPGGIVLVEPWFPPGVLRAGPGSTRHTEVQGAKVERSSHIELEGTLTKLTFTYRIEDATGVRTATELHELGIFTPEETLSAFSDAGFAATHDPVGIFDKRGLYMARAKI
jgi:SAM-dependent methyltransferase